MGKKFRRFTPDPPTTFDMVLRLGRETTRSSLVGDQLHDVPLIIAREPPPDPRTCFCGINRPRRLTEVQWHAWSAARAIEG